MAEIGPVLPPGFNKSSSRPDSDSEEDDQPQRRSAEKSSKPQGETSYMGPALPPGFKTSETADSSADSSSDSEQSADESAKQTRTGIGPVLPPGFKPSSKTAGVPKHGPSLPPRFVVQEDKEDSDDDWAAIGPMPNAGPHKGGSLAEALEHRAQKMKNQLLNKDKWVPQERENWMTELPPEMGANLGLGARKFKSGPGGSTCGDRSVWTDSPAEREKREKDAAEGKVKKRKKEDTDHIVSERDKYLLEQVEEHNKTKRAKSLLEMHESKLKKKKKKEKKKAKKKHKNKDKDSDKPSRREFDRDADLQANRFDDAMRKTVIKKSQQLGGRFSHGSQQFM